MLINICIYVYMCMRIEHISLHSNMDTSLYNEVSGWKIAGSENISIRSVQFLGLERRIYINGKKCGNGRCDGFLWGFGGKGRVWLRGGYGRPDEVTVRKFL